MNTRLVRASRRTSGWTWVAASWLVASALALLACGSEQPVAVEPTVRLVLISGQDQQGTVGAALADPIIAELSSENSGFPVANAVVAFTVTAGGGKVSALFGGGSASGNGSTFITTTNEQGRASVNFTLGPTTGTQTVSVHTSYLVKGDSVIHVEAFAIPGDVARVLKSGDGQIGSASQPLPLDVSVVVTDRYGNPLDGVRVVWSVQSGGGSLAADTVFTDATGGAATQWTLGASPGPQQVLAQVDQMGSFTFSATAQ